jgi:hypothetical protein
VPATDFFGAVDRLGWDLEVDHALTAQQVRRHYGRVGLKELTGAGFTLEQRRVKRTQGSGGRVLLRVTFVLGDGALVGLSDAALRHLVGTAEVRRVLGASRGEWSSSAWREAATMVPDALWRPAGGGRVAVEYDTGAYKRDRIVGKAEAFGEFDEQVWGCPSELRAGFVRRLVLGAAANARVVVAAAF